MIEFLKKYNKHIDFTLLFLPVLAMSFIIWDGSIRSAALLTIDHINLVYESKDYYIKLGSDFWEYIGIFMPFVLWRIFSSYWLK